MGNEQHKYVWQGSTLVSEYYGGKTLEFFYDESGAPYGFSYKSSSTAAPAMYYYVTNLQGDVTNVLDASGNTVASYTYNAWGKVLSSSGSMASINPIRYRGYYFDSDTGLYYVSSRYYAPEIGRWINADGYVSTGQGILGTNMFAYCGNNSINRLDSAGQFWSEIWNFGKTVVAEIGRAMGLISPAYAACGGFAAVDGPLPIGDIIGSTVAVLLTIGAVGYGIYRAAQAPSLSFSKAEEKVIPAPPPSSTVIYRYGGTNPGNLTPKEKDKFTGLSFSTIPKPGSAVTTIEALNATGLVCAVRDGATHVSVRPIGGTMDDWISAGSSSIWTQAVKSVTVKWDGVG